jgi:hypothetical protein
MKRTSRKLKLERSTVRPLDDAMLARTHGATEPHLEGFTFTLACSLSVPTLRTCSR